MKAIISTAIVALMSSLVLQAQSNTTLDDLLTNYNSLSQEVKTNGKKSVQRKQDRAAIKLVNYINKHGYPITVTPSQQLLVYAAPYPQLGEVVDTLDRAEQVQVYTKDRYGYYKVSTDAGEGYVQNIVANVNSKNHPLHLFDEMLSREAAVDKMLEQSRRQPRMRINQSSRRPDNAGIQ